jgi:hypothetical protein
VQFGDYFDVDMFTWCYDIVLPTLKKNLAINFFLPIILRCSLASTMVNKKSMYMHIAHML